MRGAFKSFIRKIGKRAVTEFNYRYFDPDKAYVFVGLSVASREETRQIVEQLTAARIGTFDLSDDILAKEHIRHMVGGHTRGIHNEVVCTFEFPERPGALLDFLEAISDRWNITLFSSGCRCPRRSTRRSVGRSSVSAMPGKTSRAIPRTVFSSATATDQALRYLSRHSEQKNSGPAHVVTSSRPHCLHTRVTLSRTRRTSSAWSSM